MLKPEMDFEDELKFSPLTIKSAGGNMEVFHWTMRAIYVLNLQHLTHQ